MRCIAIIEVIAGGAGDNALRRLAHTLHAANDAMRIDGVVVLSDDDVAGRLAASYGATVARGGFADALRADGAELGVWLRPSGALASADIDALVDTLLSGGAESAFVARPAGDAWERAGDGSAVQRGPAYLDTGLAWAVRREPFLEHGDRHTGRVAMHVLAQAAGETAPLLSAHALPSPLAAVVFDFDGVFTDNRVIVTDDGHEAVLCSRGDGMGLERLRDSGVALLVLSKEKNPVVSRRAAKLRLECQQAMDDKLTFLRDWLAQRGIAPEATIYVGNDINDIECMQYVGCGVVVADAHPEARAVAKLVLRHAGGRGAIRELCDLIAARG